MRAALAILDTNVWLDWLAFDDPRVAPLASAHASGSLAIIACQQARAELVEVIGRDALARQIAAAHAKRGLAALAPGSTMRGSVVRRFDSLVTMVERAPRAPLSCSDPDDQHLIDLAVAHRTRWLFTRDRAVLALARRARLRFGVEIAQPEVLGRADAAAARAGAPTIPTDETP